jgi:FixJ family two-component response regulator
LPCVGAPHRVLEHLTISIVDDDPAVRDALRSLMASAGLVTEAFASAEEFLASPSRHDTTCLILDVLMPGMDGLELQRRLVASNWKVPIIFISAHADAEVRARALEEGAIAFFHKPFSSAALLEAIDRAQASRGEDAGQ